MRFALIFETGDSRLSNDWLQQKHNELKKKTEERDRRKVFDSNAVDSVPAMFQELEDRVRQDVDEYERLFGKALIFMPSKKDDQTFTVSDSKDWRIWKAVSASISGRGTVISIEHVIGRATASNDKFDVDADESGTIRFRYKGKFLEDVGDASKIVLERIVDAGLRRSASASG